MPGIETLNAFPAPVSKAARRHELVVCTLDEPAAICWEERFHKDCMASRMMMNPPGDRRESPCKVGGASTRGNGSKLSLEAARQAKISSRSRHPGRRARSSGGKMDRSIRARWRVRAPRPQIRLRIVGYVADRLQRAVPGRSRPELERDSWRKNPRLPAPLIRRSPSSD